MSIHRLRLLKVKLLLVSLFELDIPSKKILIKSCEIFVIILEAVGNKTWKITAKKYQQDAER